MMIAVSTRTRMMIARLPHLSTGFDQHHYRKYHYEGYKH